MFDTGNPSLCTKEGHVTENPFEVSEPKMAKFVVKSEKQLSLSGEIGITVISDTRIGQVSDHLVGIMKTGEERHEGGLINGEGKSPCAR